MHDRQDHEPLNLQIIKCISMTITKVREKKNTAIFPLTKQVDQCNLMEAAPATNMVCPLLVWHLEVIELTITRTTLFNVR